MKRRSFLKSIGLFLGIGHTLKASAARQDAVMAIADADTSLLDNVNLDKVLNHGNFKPDKGRLYHCIFRAADGKVWDPVTESWEPWGAKNHGVREYAIPVFREPDILCDKLEFGHATTYQQRGEYPSLRDPALSVRPVAFTAGERDVKE